jgi:hypothetical protein
LRVPAGVRRRGLEALISVVPYSLRCCPGTKDPAIRPTTPARLPKYRHHKARDLAVVRVEGGKLVEFIKEWDKLSMWEQLGWPIEECLSHRGG